MGDGSRAWDAAGGATRAQVEAVASRAVGELLDMSRPGRMLDPERCCDAEFADHLVDRELALIASCEEPLRIAVKLAVLSIARDVVRAYAEIHALPEPPHRVPRLPADGEAR
jgi:hypothetical protein